MVPEIKTGISNTNNFVNFSLKMANSYLKELNNIDTKKINRNNEKSFLIDAGLNMIGKKIEEKFGSGITLTNNEIKYTIKAIKSLENRGILLKGTTTKITSQEGRFINFLRPLMTAGLLTPLAKRILIPLGLSGGRCSYSKENWWIW